MLTKRLSAGAGVITLAMALTATAAYAQETTGGIRGQITAAGKPVANATVVVTHVPTGTRATSITNADGFYSTRGLRVGGPYTVEASAPNVEGEKTEVALITVGEPTAVDLVLNPAATAVAEVVVTAAPVQRNNGPTTRFTVSQIENVPSINRDLMDLARIDPFATLDSSNQNALSFAGVNTRFNQLTVDGVRQNDDFGLNNNGYPTQRSPVSLEAVQAVSVSAVPASVINDGALGGAINVVTKSGTNTFHGSGFYEKTGREWQGDSVRGALAGAPFEERYWGGTFGGPIWKDRLFFFLSYENYNGQFSLDEGPFDLGRAVSIPRISSTAVNTFTAAVKSTYGYDAGTFVTGAPPVTDEKFRARIDWNITDNHRLMFSYQKTDGNSYNGSTSSVFISGDSTTQPRIGLESTQYNKHEVLDSYTVQLNSDWTSNFSTELRYNYKQVDTTQIPLGGLTVGQVDVTVTDLAGVAAGTGTPQIRFGADISRHDNYLNTKVQTIEGIARYRRGPHELLAGIRTETDDVYNVFVGNSIGTYTFSSYANFLAKTAATFTATGAVANPSAGTVPATLGTARNGVSEFAFRQNSIYGEDNWQITDNFSVLFGLRYNWFSTSDSPVENVNFASRNGFSNSQSIDGKSIILPRVSFNWRPQSGMTMTGTLGRYSSTGLNVWLSNPFANDGVRQTIAVCPAAPFLNVDITKAPAGCTFTPGNGNTNFLAPDFKVPTVWKATLSYAYRFDLPGLLGKNWLLQGDVLYQTNENALYWHDYRARIIGQAPDGRPVYGRTTVGTIGANQFDMALANNDKGHNRAMTLTVGKDWDTGWAKGLSMRAAMTNTRGTDGNPMTSSIALSSFVRFASADHNNPTSATSDYEIRNRFSLTTTYNRRFFGDNLTNITIFAQRRSGLPFSYVFANSGTSGFDNDFGEIVTSYSGRQVSSADLLYVPQASGGHVTATSDPKVVYAAGFDVQAFDNFLQKTGLIDYAGRISPRNEFKGRSVTTVDVHLSQELPAFFPRGAKLVAYLDLLNLGNLLNDSWGTLDQYDFYRGVSVVDVTCGAAAGSCAVPGAKYTYSGLVTEPGTTDQPRKPFIVNSGSLWQLKAGIKFRF